MTTKQIKTEINKVLDSIPENVLGDVLEYLKTLQNQSADPIELSSHLRKILEEDRLLLARLAK